MPSFLDLKALVRKTKPDKVTSAIRLRPKSGLMHVSQVKVPVRARILLDTNI